MPLSPLKIVIMPVENLTNEIIPGNQREMFVARLQGLLASRPELANRFVWVLNKADYEKLRSEKIPGVQTRPREKNASSPNTPSGPSFVPIPT